MGPAGSWRGTREHAVGEQCKTGRAYAWIAGRREDIALPLVGK